MSNRVQAEPSTRLIYASVPPPPPPNRDDMVVWCFLFCRLTVGVARMGVGARLGRGGTQGAGMHLCGGIILMLWSVRLHNQK